MRNCFWGQHEAAWIAFYKFTAEIGVKYQGDDLAILNAWGAIAESCCWWAPWEGVCILSDRPRHVSFDDQGRLHHELGAAVRFSDGWGVHAIHGVRVPDFVIEKPEQITVKVIEAEQNAEVRRIMVNRFGMARYIRESGATAIDHEEGIGTLYRKDEGDDLPILMVEVVNSTPEPDGTFKRYMLDVSSAGDRLMDDRPDVKGQMTARAAVAATFGLRASQYRPAVET